ncbi:MAG: hypothetical protein K6T66_00025 [Peptococcaceae bacterium]|nr:hypothetical protein [Peptococcaceae bacterium]
MAAGGYTERLLARLFFGAVLLFLSLHLFTAYKDSAAGDTRPPVAGGQSSESLTFDPESSVVHPGPRSPASDGVKGGGQAGWTPGSPVVTFYLKDYSLMPYLRVVVNGEVAGSFKNRYVTVPVQDGDVIALDGTFYNRPVAVEVLGVSAGVAFPAEGGVITLDGNLVTLGRVRVNTSTRR